MKDKIATYTLILASLVFGIIFGVGVLSNARGDAEMDCVAASFFRLDSTKWSGGNYFLDSGANSFRHLAHSGVSAELADATTKVTSRRSRRLCSRWCNDRSLLCPGDS